MKTRFVILFFMGVLLMTGCAKQNPVVAETSSEALTTSTESNPVNPLKENNQETETLADSTKESTPLESLEEDETNTMNVKIGENTYTATLADNSSAKALKEILSKGSLTINMKDYANMEKVGSIGQSIVRNDEQITTEPGDIILYQGNSLVIYYDTNSWSFTRIGKMDGMTQDELKKALGTGDVTVTLSLE